MRIVATACLVLAILFMVGCGTSAEDKKLITEYGTKIGNVEKKVDGIEKMAVEMGKKVDAVMDYLTKNPIGKAKFEYPPAEVKPPVPPAKPGAAAPKKDETKKEEPKKPEPAKSKEPAKTK